MLKMAFRRKVPTAASALPMRDNVVGVDNGVGLGVACALPGVALGVAGWLVLGLVVATCSRMVGALDVACPSPLAIIKPSPTIASVRQSQASQCIGISDLGCGLEVD
jgi:hypothetical protein